AKRIDREALARLEALVGRELELPGHVASALAEVERVRVREIRIAHSEKKEARGGVVEAENSERLLRRGSEGVGDGRRESFGVRQAFLTVEVKSPRETPSVVVVRSASMTTESRITLPSSSRPSSKKSRTSSPSTPSGTVTSIQNRRMLTRVRGSETPFESTTR